MLTIDADIDIDITCSDSSFGQVSQDGPSQRRLRTSVHRHIHQDMYVSNKQAYTMRWKQENGMNLRESMFDEAEGIQTVCPNHDPKVRPIEYMGLLFNNLALVRRITVMRYLMSFKRRKNGLRVKKEGQASALMLKGVSGPRTTFSLHSLLPQGFRVWHANFRTFPAPPKHASGEISR